VGKPSWWSSEQQQTIGVGRHRSRSEKGRTPRKLSKSLYTIPIRLSLIPADLYRLKACRAGSKSFMPQNANLAIEIVQAAPRRITILVAVQNLQIERTHTPKWTQQLSSLNWNPNEIVSIVPLQRFREAGAVMLGRHPGSPMDGKGTSRPQREGRSAKP
jgi:hypothetical protein